MNFSKKYLVKPGEGVDLAKFDPRKTWGIEDKDKALIRLQENVERLNKLQYTLYAEDRRSVLVILQGMDTAGKDGAIRHVMSGLNPQGCKVVPFKTPTREELDHDFLWRIHRAVPPRGEIGIFNRSHYEDVLVVRVENLVPESVWSKRYGQIRRFERNLAETGTTLLKFFLCISKDEQRERLQARLDDPAKHWKFNPSDLETRTRWEEYVKAYEAALKKCSTAYAPWFIVPADRKWFRNLVISEILCETLEAMKLELPKPQFDVSGITVE